MGYGWSPVTESDICLEIWNPNLLVIDVEDAITQLSQNHSISYRTLINITKEQWYSILRVATTFLFCKKLDNIFTKPLGLEPRPVGTFQIYNPAAFLRGTGQT